MNDLEPKIRPLVDVLNQIGIIQTFSSCEGHFDTLRSDGSTTSLVDRSHAEVRFVPAPNVALSTVEQLLAFVLTRFKAKHGLIPVKISGYKLYTPIDEKTVEETFVLELRPFNRFDSPERKRSDIDRAIEQTTELVKMYEV
ncbi:hypothetical protein GCM10028807_40270 [Spirosoma daeguense]